MRDAVIRHVRAPAEIRALDRVDVVGRNVKKRGLAKDQDGDGNGKGGPGYEIRGEFTANGFKNDLKHTLGVLSMARTMIPDSAGSQFFIMVEDAPHLDGQYAGFGKITENAQAAIDISRVNRDMFTDKPKKPQTIKSIRVDTLGVEYPAPEKV